MVVAAARPTSRHPWYNDATAHTTVLRVEFCNLQGELRRAIGPIASRAATLEPPCAGATMLPRGLQIWLRELQVALRALLAACNLH